MKRSVLLLAGIVSLAFLLASPSNSYAFQDSENDEAAAKKFEAIAKRYHSLIERRPRKGTAFDLLYRHYLDAGKLDDLYKRYTTLKTDEPDNAAAQLVYGLLAERRGQNTEALEAYESAGKLNEDDFYSLYYRGLLLSKLHVDDEAIKTLRTSLDRKPTIRTEIMDVYKKLGRLHARQGRSDDALKVWSEMSEAFPDDRFALEELARLLSEEEQFEEAIKRYNELIKLAKDNLYKQLVARVEIGQIQVRQGKLQTAIKTFESCLDQVKPDSWNADDIRRRIEEIFQRSDDLDGLAEYYRERLKKHPDDLNSMVRLAATTARLGDLEAALKQYRAAVKLAPTRRDLRETLVSELSRAKRFAEAITESEALLAAYPKDVEIMRELGLLYLRSQPAESVKRDEVETKALAVWKRISDVRPSDPLLAVQVAELCRQTVDIGSRIVLDEDLEMNKKQSETTMGKAALKYYELAVARAKGVPQYHEYLGEFLHAIGRADDAVAAWNRIAEAPNNTLENYKRLAEVLQSADSIGLALNAVNQAISQDSKRYDLHALAAELYTEQEEFDDALKHISTMEELADTGYFEEQALTRRVEVYGTARILDQEAKKLADLFDAGKGTARDYWLAGMIATNRRQEREALAFVTKALELKPDDPRLLRYKAQVHRSGGDLSGAAEQFTRLAEIEPKNQTAHLRELVAIRMELGQFEEAKKLAQQIVSLAPGNVDGVTLLSEVAFRSGSADDGLEALRRAVRNDPRSVELRQALAAKLAQYHHIDEAIEHYWRIFELVDDFDSKIGVTGSLADQYAIAGKSEELANRLLRMREDQEDATLTTLCLVEAYTRIEDYINARRELGALSARRPNDMNVLLQLVSLSERLEDNAEAARYLERVVGVSKERAHRERLAILYTKTGEEERAKELWDSLAQEVGSADDRLRAMDSALAKQNFALVETLGEPYWTENPDDWRVAFRLGFAYWKLDKPGRTKKVAEHLLAQAPSDKYKYVASKATKNAMPGYYNMYPPILIRMNLPTQIRSMMSSNNRGYYLNSSYWSPKSLEDAQLVAVVFLSEAARKEMKHDEFVAQLKKEADADIALAKRLVWLYTAENKQPEAIAVVDRLSKEMPNDIEVRLYRLMRWSYYRQQNQDLAKFLPQLKEDIDRIREKKPKLSVWVTTAYIQALMSANKKDEAVKEMKEVIKTADNVFALSQISYQVTRLNDLELFGEMMAKVEELAKNAPSSTAGWFNPASMLQQYIQNAAQQKKWDSVLTYYERYMDSTHPKVIRGQPLTGRQANFYSPYASHRSGSTNSIGEFPSANEYLNESRLGLSQQVYTGLQSIKKEKDFEKLLADKIKKSEGIAKQCWDMLSISVDWWNGSREEAIERLAKFQKSQPGNMELKMTLAKSYAGINEPEKALAVIEKVYLPFGSRAKALEKMRLELAQRANDEKLGKQASLRLFGMRLDSNEQVMVARAMRRFGLTARSQELMDRAVRTASNRPNDLYNLMRNQTDPKKAAGIAKTLLRQTRAAGQNNSYASYRMEAYRVLNRTGDLTKMIETTEEQLKNAPKSIKLLNDLADYYTAANNNEKAFEMLERVTEVNPKDAKVAYRVAQTYFQRSKFEEGIKKLEVVWARDPQVVLQNGYNMGQYYFRAKKLDLLAEHISKLKDSSFLQQNGYMLDNIISNLRNRTGVKVDDIIKLYKVALDVAPPNYAGSLQYQFAEFLLQKKRKPEAFAVFKQSILPPEKPPENPNPFGGSTFHSYTSYSNGTVSTPLVKFVNLAKELDKIDTTKKEIQDAAKKNKSFAPTFELLMAMFAARAGDEKPIRGIGNKYVEDNAYKSNMGTHINTLRAELQNSDDKETLKVALKVWAPDPQTVANNPGYYDSSSVQARARIHIKLEQRVEARKLLMSGIEVTANPFQTGQTLEEMKMDRFSQISSSLRQLGFDVESLDVYGQILELNRSRFGNNASHVLEWRFPETYRNIRQIVNNTLDKNPSKAIERLQEEFASGDKAHLNGYFTAVDPPSAQEFRRYNGSSQKLTRKKEEEILHKQLLPSLLAYAKRAKKLDGIKTAFGKYVASSKDLKLTEREKLQLDCFAILLDVAAGQHKAQTETKLAALAKRYEDKKFAETTGAGTELWVVALAVGVKEAKTAASVKAIATAMSNIAARRGDSERQRSAFLLVTTGEDENSDAVLQQMLAKRKGDPATALQVAEIYLQRKDLKKGLDLLKLVWDRNPALILPKLREISVHYVTAKRMSDLAKGIGSIRDRELIQRYNYRFSEVMGNMRTPVTDIDGLIEYYHATLDITEASYHANAHSNFAQALRGAAKTEKTYLALRSVVLPTKRSLGAMQYAAKPLLDMSAAMKKLDDLESATTKAIDENGAWKPKGQLMLAMIDMRRGKEERISRLASEYVDNPALVASLQDVSTLLREELGKCKSEAPLRAAIKLWEDYDITSTSYNSGAVTQIATLLNKLGEKEKARERLLAAVNKPFPPNYSSGEEYVLQEKLQRMKMLAQQLDNLEFTMDALSLHARIAGADTSFANSGSYLFYLRREANDTIQRLVGKLLKDNTEKTTDGLIAALKSEKQPVIDPYLVVIDPNSAGSNNSSVKKDPVPTSILLPVLKFAREKQKIGELTEAAATAKERFPKASALVELETLITITGDTPNKGIDHLQKLTEAIAKDKKLAMKDRNWLLAREAMKVKATRAAGEQLAEAIVNNLPKSHRSRQTAVVTSLTASFMASGQTDRANTLMTKLVESAKDLDSQMQVAEILMKRKDFDGAMKIYKSIWDSDVSNFYTKFELLAKQFVIAKRVPMLVKAMQDVEFEKEQMQTYGYNILNAAQQLSMRKETQPEGIELLIAVADVLPQPYKSQGYAYLGSAYRNANKHDEAYETTLKAVLPPTGAEGLLSSYAYTLINEAKRHKMSDKLTAALNKAIKDYPEWKENGELCLAIVDKMDGNEDRLEKVAARFHEDAEYATRMKPSIKRFQSLLLTAKSPESAKIAEVLAEEEVERQRSQPNSSSYGYYIRLADVQIVLKKTDKARQTLLAALTNPMPRYSANYIPYYQYRQRDQLARAMDRHGFLMDAALLYRENIEMDVSAVGKSYRMESRLQQQRVKLRTLIKKTVEKNLDKAIASLEAELKKPKDIDVRAYLWKFPKAWTPAEHGKFPAHVKKDGEDVTKLAFVTMLARHAQKQSKLASLTELIGTAKTKYPKNAGLQNLEKELVE